MLGRYYIKLTPIFRAYNFIVMDIRAQNSYRPIGKMNSNLSRRFFVQLIRNSVLLAVGCNLKDIVNTTKNCLRVCTFDISLRNYIPATTKRERHNYRDRHTHVFGNSISWIQIGSALTI